MDADEEGWTLMEKGCPAAQWFSLSLWERAGVRALPLRPLGEGGHRGMRAGAAIANEELRIAGWGRGSELRMRNCELRMGTGVTSGQW